MTATRDVTVRMKIEAQGTGSKALDELASKADKAAQAESRLGKAGADLARSQEQASTGVNRLNTSLTEQAKRQQEVRTAIDRAIESSRRQSEMDRALAKDKQYLTAMIEAESAALAKQQALAKASGDARYAQGLSRNGPTGTAGSGGMNAMAQGGLIISTLRDASRLATDLQDATGAWRHAFRRRAEGADVDGMFTGKDKHGKTMADRISGQGMIGSVTQPIWQAGKQAYQRTFGLDEVEQDFELFQKDRREKASDLLRAEELDSEHLGFSEAHRERQHRMGEERSRIFNTGIDEFAAKDIRAKEAKARQPLMTQLVESQKQLAPSLFKDATAQQRLAEQQRQLTEMNRRGGESLTAPDRAVRSAEHEKYLASKEQETIEAKIVEWRNRSNSTYAEGKVLTDQLNANIGRRMQAEQGVIAALRQQHQTQAENIRQYKDFAAAQQQHYASIAAAEKDRLKGQQEQFGGMNAFDRHFARQVLEKARDQGMESLMPEELQVAQQYAPTKAKDYFREIAEKEGFPQLQEQLGEADKLNDAKGAEQFYAAITVKLESEIKTIVDTGSSVIDKLNNDLYPKILKAMTQQDQAIKDLETKLNNLRAANRTLAPGP